MGAEPGRRFLKQQAAKLEPVIVASVEKYTFYCASLSTTSRIHGNGYPSRRVNLLIV